jgi:glycosyltransferase involved in cell wall biosynthesis
MTTHWWGRPHLGIVIHNGIEMKPVRDFTSLELLAIRKSYEKVFVCSANWHPQKRLADNVAMFKHLRKMHPNSCLIVMGANPDYMCADPGIFYSGSLPPELYMQVYSMADWMIHLAWLDHCPNVVIEALSQNTPVICTDAGGTRELVGDNGIILAEAPYNFELANYDDPPHVDVTQLTKLELPKGTFDASALSILDIQRVAHVYEGLFNKVVYNNEVPC